jgi:ribonuclease HI
MPSIPKKLTLFCDGASRGNPGPGAYGFVLMEGEKVVSEKGGKLGSVTNNFAEYQGLLQGLAEAITLAATHITVKSDSELLVRQLNGQYQVKAPNLIPLFEKAQGLLKKFSSVSIEHIPREMNEHADRLCNAALDS